MQRHFEQAFEDFFVTLRDDLIHVRRAVKTRQSFVDILSEGGSRKLKRYSNR